MTTDHVRTAAEAAESGPRPRPAAAWTVTYLLFVVMLGGTLPTPVYSLYAQKLGLTPLVIALVFAAYAGGILVVLLLFGGLSDQIGRRAAIAPALALTVLSCLTFAVLPTLPGIVAGRILSGLSVGLTMGAATAYLGELHLNRAKAALISSVTGMVGLGCGPLLSGVLVQYVPHPLVTPYLVLAAMALPGLLLARLPETVSRGRLSIRPQRLGIPADMRSLFTAAAAAAFCSLAVLGLLSALTSRFLAEGLHITSPVTVGVVVLCAFGSAGLAQLATVRLAPHTSAAAGMVAVPLGLVLIVAALPASSLSPFLLGSVLSGAGGGAAFKAGLALVTGHAPPGRTSEAVSAYFVGAYLGMAVPAIGVGLLVTVTSLTASAAVFAAVVTVLAAVSITATASTRPGRNPL
ncbi:MFS transporter [Streptomyces violascens]|uniref:MFS transporter n=1 Tax=Streptomyces violascens TaxID=67381 RepID=UPI0036B08C36